MMITHPKTYHATSKEFPKPIDDKKKSKLSNENSHVGRMPLQTSKSIWSCKSIKVSPDESLRLWKKSEMKNGVVQYTIKYPFGPPISSISRAQWVKNNSQ